MSSSPEITAGEAVAIKLKECFFKDEAWKPRIAFQVGIKLCQLKAIAKPYYPEKDMVQTLHVLSAYSIEDIREAFEGNSATEGKLCLNQPNAIGAHLAHSMATM